MSSSDDSAQSDESSDGSPTISTPINRRLRFYRQIEELTPSSLEIIRRKLEKATKDAPKFPRQENVENTNRPFEEAMEAIKSRKLTVTGVELDLPAKRTAPTLMYLTLRVIADETDAITYLNLAPVHLRTEFATLSNRFGKLGRDFIDLMIQCSPSEVVCRNCMDLCEKELRKILCDCTSNVHVLILDFCGPALTEFSIREFLNLTPNGFASLTTLSLRGAFHLSDDTLGLIAKSTTLLRVVDLSDCSALTSRAIQILADNSGSTLDSLKIDGCVGITSSFVFFTALLKFICLKSLSFAGLETIKDGFVIIFITKRASNLTHLSLAYCNKLTECSILTMKRCSNLESLDISGLDKLTDIALQDIADGCSSLNSIKLMRNKFRLLLSNYCRILSLADLIVTNHPESMLWVDSDKAIAAFLEVLGGSLYELCLNNVQNVGQNTAFSLAKVCKKLRYLDLSWCLKLTEKDLTHILNSCKSLKSVWLFGWRQPQVTDEFIEQARRLDIEIIGLKMMSRLDHCNDR